MDSVSTTTVRTITTGGDHDVLLEVALLGGREEVGALGAIPFEEVAALVTKIAAPIGAALESARPTKAGIEVGVEFGLQEGKLVAMVARGSAKANLKISLEWAKPAK